MPKKSKKTHHQSGGDVLLYNPENKTSVPFRVLPTMEPDQVASVMTFLTRSFPVRFRGTNLSSI